MASLFGLPTIARPRVLSEYEQRVWEDVMTIDEDEKVPATIRTGAPIAGGDHPIERYRTLFASAVAALAFEMFTQREHRNKGTLPDFAHSSTRQLDRRYWDWLIAERQAWIRAQSLEAAQEQSVESAWEPGNAPNGNQR